MDLSTFLSFCPLIALIVQISIVILVNMRFNSLNRRIELLENKTTFLEIEQEVWFQKIRPHTMEDPSKDDRN